MLTSTTAEFAPARRAAARAGRGRRTSSQRRWAAAFLTPSLGIIGAFVLLPILLTAWISLHNWSMYTPLGQMDFVGLEHYRALATDRTFRQALVNTALYTVLSVGLIVPLALGAGMLLFFPRARGSSGLRTLLFATYMIPTVAVAIIWGALYAPRYGPVNQALQAVGLPAQPWLGSVDLALVSLVIFNVWQLLGYFTVLIIAGLTQIPPDMHEAAALDGAGPLQRLWYVTIPLLRRTLTFVVVIAGINSVQVFDPIYVLTQGGPANATNTLSYHIYRTAFDFGLAGRASAMAFVMLALLAAAVVPVLRLGRER